VIVRAVNAGRGARGHNAPGKQVNVDLSAAMPWWVYRAYSVLVKSSLAFRDRCTQGGPRQILSSLSPHTHADSCINHRLCQPSAPINRAACRQRWAPQEPNAEAPNRGVLPVGFGPTLSNMLRMALLPGTGNYPRRQPLLYGRVPFLELRSRAPVQICHGTRVRVYEVTLKKNKKNDGAGPVADHSQGNALSPLGPLAGAVKKPREISLLSQAWL